MQLVLKLVSSVSIKRKKPWPKLSWIGQEQDGLYLLDGKRISQLNIPSGKTKKKIPKLYDFLNDVCALNVSQNGEFLCGALIDGKIFLWDRDNDRIQFITGLPRIFNEADKGKTKNRIFFSPSGNMILLMVGFQKLFLWQRRETRDSDNSLSIAGTWSQVHHGEYYLPDGSNKEATVDGVFYADEVVGKCGLFSYVFNKGTELTITSLTVKSCDKMNVSNLAHDLPNQHGEITSGEVVEKMNCCIKWRSMNRPLYAITPATRLVKGSFVYVSRYSPDGQVLAVVINQKLAKNTRLLFCSILHSTSCIVDLKCCGGSNVSSGRTWWVSDIAWTSDSLLLLGITRNGAMFITTKLGEPVKLVTTGYGMDMGPSLFLSLHPRITVKSFQENIPPDNSEISSGSEKDIFHQKFSVAVHCNQPLLLCSDGYMVTIFLFDPKPDYSKTIAALNKDVAHLLSRNNAAQELQHTATCTHSASSVSPFIVSFGKDSERGKYNSPESTMSEANTDFGLARDIEAGVISFGETESHKNIPPNVEDMNEQQRIFSAECVLLQALGIATSCGRHWSQDINTTVNLLIHTSANLFTRLLENESNGGLSGNDDLFHHMITFVQSCFQAFRWDMVYQQCLPWLTQFVHSTVKCFVSCKNFDIREVVDFCMKFLHMAELFLHEIYMWTPVSDCFTAHFAGDSFVPPCDSYDIPRNNLVERLTVQAKDPGNQPAKDACNVPDDNQTGNPIKEQITNLPARRLNLGYKLVLSWLTLYEYTCEVFKSKLNSGCGQKDSLDKEFVQTFCLIQRKLQTMNTPRNLIFRDKMESFARGYRMYLNGNYSQAADILETCFHDNSENVTVVPQSLNLNLTGPSSRPPVTMLGATFVKDELYSKSSKDIHNLLSVLCINLENYDLKAALTLVNNFVAKTSNVCVQKRSTTETKHQAFQTVISVDDSEVKITPSSSLKMLQLSISVKYPLTYVVDDCAMPVVQQLARFMACYFTNTPLVIPAPFQVLTSFFQHGNVGKPGASAVKTLSQRRVTEVIAQQKLELLWTADHTMELLLVSGLLGEAAWFASRLGDWKIAFLLAVTEGFRQKSLSFVRKKSDDDHVISVEIPEPEQIMKERINIILKLDERITEDDVEVPRGMINAEHISSVQSILEASVITGLNLVPDVIKQLLVVLKESVSQLSWIVPQNLYLPAPPLYCPQPARNDGGNLGEETHKEISLRIEIAIAVHKMLVMFKASRCFLYCAQKYCKHVVKNRSSSQTLPSIINELITTEAVGSEEEESGVVASFQEFCGLMWLLDVRNELALATRRYSQLKLHLSEVISKDEKQEVVKQCKDVLVWLQRLLPFSRFLDATEEILDGILTMISELPLDEETFDLLARYFHNPSPFLGIPATDKLNRITRKIRNRTDVLENGESPSVLFLQKCKKQRKEQKKMAPLSCNRFLEAVPEFCDSLEYQHDIAFLSFLDTFLLVTLAKSITTEDYKKPPLILPYPDKPTLEIPSFDETTNKKNNLGIQRSQSFQDMTSMKGKPGNVLLSPDYLQSENDSQFNRSSSLIDLRRIQPSSFSQELKEFLPTLLWLKRWCLIQVHHKGTVNKGFVNTRSVNMTNTPTAIRVRLPLKLVVNTLWLMENYYKDFAPAKGKCLRNKHISDKKVSNKEIVRVGIAEDVLVEDERHTQLAKSVDKKFAGNKTDVKSGFVETSAGGCDGSKRQGKTSCGHSREILTREENLQMLENEQVMRKNRRNIKKKIRKSQSRGHKIERQTPRAKDLEETIEQTKLPRTMLEACLGMEEEYETGIRKTKLTIVSRNMNESRAEKGESKATKSKDLNEYGSASCKYQKSLGLKNRFETSVVQQMVVDRSVSKSDGSTNILCANNFQQHANNDFQLTIAPVSSQTDENVAWDKTVSARGSTADISCDTRIKYNLFSSSSSFEGKWKIADCVDADIPLLTFVHSYTPRKLSDEEQRNVFGHAMSESDNSVFGDNQEVHYDDESSESLSVGQIRSEVAVQMRVAGNVNSDTSVTSTRKNDNMKLAAKENTYNKMTSSYDSLGKRRYKDETSLLRRIIRSEMRKFVQIKQADITSHNSTVYTTVEESSSDQAAKENKARKCGKLNKQGNKDMYKGKKLCKTNGCFEFISSKPDDCRISSVPFVRQPVNGEYIQQTTEGVSTSEGHQHDDMQNLAQPTFHQRSNKGDASSNDLYSTRQHDAMQNPPQVLPSVLNPLQFPSICGWPSMPNNSTFCSFPGPPWVWSNTAVRENSDKAIQVGPTAAFVSDVNQTMQASSKDPKQVVFHPQAQIKSYGTSSKFEHNCSKITLRSETTANKTSSTDDKTSIRSVAVQKDTSEKEGTSKESNCFPEKEDVVSQGSSHTKEAEPIVLLWNSQMNVRDESNTSNKKESCRKNHDIFSMKHFPRNEINRASTVDGLYTLHLLEFPTDVHSPPSQSLPLKIAWPEQTPYCEPAVKELPLLQLCVKQPTDTAHMSFRLPPGGDNQDGNFSDFHLVKVPENTSLQLPLLYLPEAGFEPTEFCANYEKNSKTKRGCAISRDRDEEKVGETSKARIKRRNQLASQVAQTTSTSQQLKKPVSQPTSSVNLSGDLVTTTHDTSSKGKNSNYRRKKPTREKLKELNDIIRDLQGGVTDDDDFLIPEVSSILSPGVRYEDFTETRVIEKERRANRDKALASTSVNSYNERHRRQYTGKMVESGVPRLYRSAPASARDIHTEIPPHLPEQSMPVDVKVGTNDALRFAISVQTDPVFPTEDTASTLRLQPTHRIIEQSQAKLHARIHDRQARLETKELSIQTEPEFNNIPSKGLMYDAASNTENIVKERESDTCSATSVYPRVPADVYLPIHDFDDKPPNRISSIKDCGRPDETNGLRFFSVVDIDQCDNIRQTQIRDKRISEDNMQGSVEPIEGHCNAIHATFSKGTNILVDDSGAMPSTTEATLADKPSDPATLAVFASTEISQPISLSQVTHRGNSLIQAKQLSKEKLSMQLQEMNEQFDAIDELTSNMEHDLQRSNRLLRTIVNLNKTTGQKTVAEKRKKSAGPKVRQTVEDTTRTANEYVTHFPNVSTQNDEMNSGRRVVNDIQQENNLSFPKHRSWINKPVEAITKHVAENCIDERSTNSVENGQQIAGTKFEDEILPDTIVPNRTSDMVDSKDIRDAAEYRDTMEDIQNRRSSVSQDTESLQLFGAPEDVRNVRSEKIKDIVAETTTSTISKIRKRDKTPQKQQELKEWMSKKRKLRHKEWTHKLNEKRGAEFKPFQSKTLGEQKPVSSKQLKQCEKEREDCRRTQKKEHVDERLMSAYDLMNEMVTEQAPKNPALIIQNSVRSSHTNAGKKTSRVKANNRYKDKKIVNRRKKPTEKTRLKSVTELHGTRIIRDQPGLRDFSSLVRADHGRNSTSTARVYDYDIEESARQFITRKSYENYKQKKSTSLDFDRSVSLRIESSFQLDPWVDQMIEDVSPSNSLDLQRLGHLDTLLSGDSELRDLLSDVIPVKPRFLETKDNFMSDTKSRTPEIGWRVTSQGESNGNTVKDFKMDEQENRIVKNSFQQHPDHILSKTEDDNLEMSDEVAALLAEAKAAVGDDFSETSEVEDIDWNELNKILDKD